MEHHPTIPEMNGYFVGRPKNWKDYYELAAKQCAEILGATDNPHELDPSYENIWSTVNHLEYNKYNENLFESLLVKDRMEMWGPRWDTT